MHCPPLAAAAQSPFNTEAFWAPLKSTIVQSKGSGSPTFTRATTAVVTDWEGILRTAISGEVRFTGARRVRNLVSTKSEDFSNAAWAVSSTASKVGAAPIAAPNGSVAYEISFGANATSSLNQVINVIAQNNVGVFSIYLYAPIATTVRLQVVDQGGANTLVTVSVTAGWTRFSLSRTILDASGLYGIFILNNAGGNAANVYVAQAQLENVTGQSNQNPAEYVSVGVLSAPYHGANVDGVKYFTTENGNTVSNNVVTEATGAAIPDATLDGYLAEGARTNLCLQSQTLGTTWAASNITVAANAVAAPDGTTTAETLTASAANGTLIQDLGVIASAVKTFSIWLKRKTGTGNIDLTLDNGSTWTTKTITSSWARYEITQTLADPDCGIRIVTDTDAIWAWGGQVEAAAFASSYIATTTVAVARNADVLSYPSSGNISGSAGTMYAEYKSNGGSASSNENIVTFSAAGYGAGDGILLRANNLTTLVIGGNSSSTSKTGLSLSTRTKCAGKYSGVNMTPYGNGVAGTPAATLDFTGTGTTKINVGDLDSSGAQPAFGNIRNVRIWLTALSDQQIASL